MKNELKGFQKIFGFTFLRQVTSKAYLLTTIIVGLLCLAIPAAAIILPELFARENVVEEGGEGTGNSDFEMDYAQIERVYVADESQEEEIDFSFLQIVGEEPYADIEYIWCGTDLEGADAQASDDENAMLLLIRQVMGGYELKVMIPSISGYTYSDAWALADYLGTYGQGILNAKAGIDFRKTAELSIPVFGGIYEADGANAEDAESGEEVTGGADRVDDIFADDFWLGELKDLVYMVLTYLVVMLMYFMILFYGQGIANSVILEKSSKLIDTFLVSVRPSALIFGKVMAVVCASILQLSVWILLVIGSFVGGSWLLQQLVPDNMSTVVQVFSSLKNFTALFSIPGLFMGIAVMLLGFMMYATLASICGALVDKAEDLSSTIGVFTIVLVFSFMITLYGGVLEGQAAAWMNLIPFTAALVLPSGLLLGKCSLWMGLASMGIMLVCTLILLVLAGRIYKLMVFYRGKRPSVKEIVRMLATSK